MPTPSDDLYRSIATQRRRNVLAYLHESDVTTESLDDVVDAVVEKETHSPGPDRESVRIDLYHRHLPLLDEAGIIDFDAYTETVQYENNSQIEALLRATPALGTDQDSDDP